MAKKLFVGGFPYSTTSPQLEEMFSKIGKVLSCEVINDRETGQSKGFAFIEMENDQEAEEAIEKLNDTEIDGRKIVVNAAKPRVERTRPSSSQRGPRRDDRGFRGGGGGRRR
jgi:RNA recognition motif-containing protein